MSIEGPRHSQREPELPEPYESLVRHLRDRSHIDEAQARLYARLGLDLAGAIVTFNTTTTRLNRVLISLTVVLVLLGLVQLLVMAR